MRDSAEPVSGCGPRGTSERGVTPECQPGARPQGCTANPPPDRCGVAASGCVSGQDRRWNHNIHYYPLILAAVPAGCERVLDVGCGEGMLARQLACRVPRVLGIDQDDASIEAARRQGPGGQIEFVCGDFLTHSFPPASFSMITCVAALHHMDAAAAAARMSQLLVPGGTLVIWPGPLAAARPALGGGRGHRQPWLPDGQGLLGAAVADGVAAAARLPPDPRSRQAGAAGCEIPPAPAVAVLAGLGQASVVGAAETAPAPCFVT